MEDDLAPTPSRRRLWFAVAVSVAAIPLLLWENRSDSSDSSDAPLLPTVATVVVPVERPATGPPKGVSVVTTSTTSSTLPITTIATSTTSP